MFNFLLLSVFLVSLSTLAFEVLLTRVFSIAQWNHLSFMVISIALLGFGASGTFLSVADIRKRSWLQQIRSWIGMASLLYLFAISTIGSFLTLNYLPLDYFRLAVEPVQFFYLLAAYLLLALPFFLAGLIISIAYVTAPEKTGLVYFASMAGSAAGAVLPVLLLPLIGEGHLIILAGSLSLLPVIISTISPLLKSINSPADQRRWRILATAYSLTFLFFILFILGVSEKTFIHVKPSSYKTLSQFLQFPNTGIVETSSSIRGRIDRIQSPYIRYAPGLSLKYTEALPGQSAIFKDGDNQFTLYDFENTAIDTRFAKYLLSYSGYYLRQNPQNVLLLASGGGLSIPCASASGAERILIVESSPAIAQIISRRYSIRAINQNPRTFLAQDHQTYDVIHIENWGTSIPGAAALHQDHLLTIDAFTTYLNHLNPDGVVIVSRKLLLPPSDSLRLWGTAYESLKRIGIDNPENCLAILRNFDTFTLLVSNSKIDFNRMTDFAGARNFDLVFLHGMRPEMANRFNVFDKPYHFDEANRLAAMYRTGRQKEFFRQYLLDVVPQSDRRPFPNRFLKWSNVKALHHSMGNRFYALFMSGEIVVSVVFGQALFIAGCLLIIPLIVSTRHAQKPQLALISYFFAVGVGFMFIEIYFIKRIVILVGTPVVSFTVVLAGVLFFTCLGGLWIHKYPLRNLRLPLMVLIMVLVVEVAAFELLVPSILKAPEAIRLAIVLLFLLPAGFLMGLPFPLGMRYFLKHPVQRAYAWSVNGCASVLSAILAAQFALSWGFVPIAAAGVIAYGIALLSAKR